MKCLSRSTLGIVIGGINIIIYAATIIYILKALRYVSGLTEQEKERIDNGLFTSVPILFILLGIFVLAIIISGLLIAGIIKRRHSLMAPWIYSTMAVFVCEGFLLVIGVFIAVIEGQRAGDVFYAFMFGIFTMSIQLFIFQVLYKLYKDIRDTSNEHDRNRDELETK